MAPGDTALRRLTSRWIAEAVDVSPSKRVAVAVQYAFETGVEPSLQLIRSPARGNHIQNAIFAVAKLGGPEHLTDLKVLLRDESVLSQRKSNGNIDLRSHVREIARDLSQAAALSHDDSPPSTRQVRERVVFSSQVRDVALAAMIHIIGQNPRDYGFTELQPRGQYLYVPNTAGFDSEERRSRAFLKWKLWAKVQQLQSLEVDETAVEGVRL